MAPLDRRLVQRVPALRRHLVALVAGTVVSTVALVVQAVAIARVVTAVFLEGADVAASWGWILVVPAAGVVRAAAGWAIERMASVTSQRMSAQLRSEALDRVAALPHGTPGLPHSGAVATTLTRGLAALERWTGTLLPALVSAAVVPPTIVVWTLRTDLVSGLVLAVTVPIIPVFLVLVGWAAERRASRQWEALQRLSSHFLDVLRGLPTLRSFGRADHQVDVIRARSDELRATTMSTLRVAFLSAFVLELFAMLGIATVAVIIGVRLVAGTMALEAALVVLLLAPEAYLPIRRLGEAYHASQEGMQAADRILTLCALRPDRPPGRRPAPDPAVVPVRLDQVSVGYPGRPVPALDRVDLDLEPGTLTAVVGASGAGKSTLAAVVLGLAPWHEGRCTVGDVDLAELDPVAWRARIGWVPQRPALLAGSVADNVRAGSPSPVSARALTAALEAAGADRIASVLPDGLATPVGPGGRNLSAGERRRIALARVLARDPSLVILDEPTSDLDPESEAVLRRTLLDLRGRRTLLLLTHRPALASLADQVVVLDAGRVVEQGPPGALLARDGAFLRLAVAGGAR